MVGRRVLVVGAGQTDYDIKDQPIGNGRAISILLAREGARFTTIGIGLGKALACAGTERPTVEMADRAGRPVFQYQMIHEGFVFAQGGVPITEDGEFVGACGISGASTGAIDEEIAYAAVA